MEVQSFLLPSGPVLSPPSPLRSLGLPSFGRKAIFQCLYGAVYGANDPILPMLPVSVICIREAMEQCIQLISNGRRHGRGGAVYWWQGNLALGSGHDVVPLSNEILRIGGPQPHGLHMCSTGHVAVVESRIFDESDRVQLDIEEVMQQATQCVDVGAGRQSSNATQSGMCLKRRKSPSTDRIGVISKATNRIGRQIDGGSQVYRNHHLLVLALGTSKIVMLDVSVGYALSVQSEDTQYGLAEQCELDQCIMFILAQEVFCYVTVQPLQYTVSAFDGCRTTAGCTGTGEAQFGQRLDQLKATRLVHQTFQEFALTDEQVHPVSYAQSLEVGVEELQRNRSAGPGVGGVEYDR